MASCIVTGGAGFIGHNLVKALIERGDKVIVIDNGASLREFSGDERKQRFVRGSHFHTNDISDPRERGTLVGLCEGADYIFHLAALPRVQFSIQHPVESARANVDGTIAILNVAKKVGVKKFVFASSSSVYGDVETLPVYESLPLNPISPYAFQKMLGEECCQYAARVDKVPTVCLRIFNAYGPGDSPRGSYPLVVVTFLEQWLRGEPLTITGAGEQTRDFTHTSDISRAFMLAAESDVSDGEAINIGGGRPISVNYLAGLIDPGGIHKHVEERFEPRNTHAHIGLAKRRIGWEPKKRFEDGIAELRRDYESKKRPSA